MAVVNTLSALMANIEATPPVLNNPYQSFGPPITQVAYVTSTATDAATSNYRFFRLFSNCCVDSLQIMNESLGAACTGTFGIMNPDIGPVYAGTNSGNAANVANSYKIFVNTAIALTAHANWTEELYPSTAAGSPATANVGLRLWELLGLTVDPFVQFDVVCQLAVAASNAANIGCKVTYRR